MGTMKALGMAGATVLVWAAAAGAIERPPVPVFEMTDAAGGIVSSSQLTRAGNWLLVYVRPDCPPCESVLRSVDREEHPGLPSRIAVVMNTTDVGAIERVAAGFPGLAGASWYADSSNGAQALSVTTVPAVFGFRGGTIEWSVAGVLTDTTDIKAIISNWVR
jgi:hypothetical protein